MIEVRAFAAHDIQAHLSQLSSLLIDCVDGGASVSFMAGISQAQAARFFEEVCESVRREERILIAAFLDGILAGTVQVIMSMPENQPHRADISKLLVAPSARRRGLATELMHHAEQLSRLAEKTLLVLDTATGSDAERLYHRLGWTKAGVIPNYSRLPDGRLCGTTIFWKELKLIQNRDCKGVPARSVG